MLLVADIVTQTFMPPIFRPYRRSTKELELGAAPDGQRVAYHMHTAPSEEL